MDATAGIEKMSVDAKELRAHESVFRKAFALKTGWPLPNADDMFTAPRWELVEFQELKTVLNRTKQKLDCFDLDQWHAHTSKMNPAGLVVNHVRKYVRPDFLTQAWCKFYEIACGSSLLPSDVIAEDRVCTVHLCEAPGAFVSSLNHYVAVNHERSRLRWLAMTLNPYHEGNGRPDTVGDDRLILNTLDHWEFGPDYTGDIFQAGYAEHLRRTARDRFDGDAACLVTADGSMDCSDDPGEQENAVSRLHDYECMVALNVLRDGGSLVLKMFTAFECNTICRVYLLCCLFGSVVLRKPATSKPGNSEVYVVCTGYRGRSSALPFVRKFFSAGDHAAAATFPSSQIPSGFRAQLLECSKYFSDMQIRAIERNIDALSPDRRERCYRETEALQWSVCQEFVARYGLRPIRFSRQLGVNGFRPRVRISSRRVGLSYAEKMRLRHLDAGQEADALYGEVMSCDEWKKPRLREVVWGKRERLSVHLSDVQFRLGKPVTEIKGSKFCSESLIDLRARVFSKYPRVSSKVDASCRSLFYRLKLERPDASVCDLTDVCVENGDNNVAQQYHCLKSVIAALHDLSSAGDLLLIGFPLYTQMSVACFYAIASMFETHGLVRPDNEYGHAFVFLNFKKHKGWLNALDKAKGHLMPETSKHLSLVSWLPIKVLLEQTAYSDIVTLNNLCVIHEIEHTLSAFLNSNA